MAKQQMETWSEVADYIDSADFLNLPKMEQAAFMRDVVYQFRHQYPNDPDLPMLQALVAGFTHKAREEAQAHAGRN